MTKRSLIVIAATTLLLFSTGCSSKPKPKKYTLRVLPQTEARIRVDIIGANQTEINDWKSLVVSEYWRPGNAFRENALANGITFRMPEDKENATIEPKHEIWKQWFDRRAHYLVIIADLPGTHNVVDARRQIIELDKGANPKTKALDIEISDSRVTVVGRKK